MYDDLIIERMNTYLENKLYILREDLLPFSFGGNKLRKAIKFFNVILDNNYDTVITYGSSSSNHARIIANMANKYDINCIIITPKSENYTTINRKMVDYFGAKIITTDIASVHTTIEKTIAEEISKGKKPYFIQGGGHGNIGTSAYVDVFQKLLEYEKINNVTFDYIFFASGTGTTQAGLIIGDLISRSNKEIIGISIAREKSHGTKVIQDSIRDYINENKLNIDPKNLNINFIDSFIVNGYGSYNSNIESTIKNQYKTNGVALDPTYTAKAFWGMEEYIKIKNISMKNVLFIHTGGTPLFYDYISKKDENQ